MAEQHEGNPSPTARRLAAAVFVVVPLVVLVTLAGFTWSAARLSPRNLPLGVAGAPAVTALIERQLAPFGDAFDVHRYSDEAQARQAIKDRKIYGAVGVSKAGITVFTATAGSWVVADLLEKAVRYGPSAVRGEPAATPPSSLPVRVVDVVRADPDDPRGATLSALVLPLVLSSGLVGLLLAAVSRPGFRQLGAAVAASATAALAATGLVYGWLGALGGPWYGVAGVLALVVLGIVTVLLGIRALAGRRAQWVGVAGLVLLGTSWSGVASAPELLPRPFGALGQDMPPGAGGNLLRSVSFFDGADAGGHLAVLVVWCVIGLLAMTAGAVVRRDTATVGNDVPAPDALSHAA